MCAVVHVVQQARLCRIGRRRGLRFRRLCRGKLGEVADGCAPLCMEFGVWISSGCAGSGDVAVAISESAAFKRTPAGARGSAIICWIVSKAAGASASAFSRHSRAF